MGMLLHRYMYVILLCLLSLVERSSKALDEILSIGGGTKLPVENRPGDSATSATIEFHNIT